MLKGLLPITRSREPDSCRNQETTAMSMLSLSSAPSAARNACAPMISYAVATAMSGPHVGRDKGFPHHEGSGPKATIIAGSGTRPVARPHSYGPEVVLHLVIRHGQDHVVPPPGN